LALSWSVKLIYCKDLKKVKIFFLNLKAKEKQASL